MNNDKLDNIYETLKNRIVNLEYEPGVVLNEVELATEFKISRTPIRKNFQFLHSDKLLNIIPRVGAQVVAIDMKQMKSVFEITRELDPFAVRLAIERISENQLDELEEIMNRLNTYDIEVDYQRAITDDEKFHKIIYSSCNNPWLEDILTTLHYHTERLWHYSEKHFDNMDLFTDTLGEVLDAIKNKDVERAEKYARDHIDAFVEKIKSVLL